MKIELTEQQQAERTRFREFVETKIVPVADQYDREEYTPPAAIEQMARQGYLGAIIPRDYAGGGMDMITYGLLNEEVGRGCSSLRSLITVHSMVAYALMRWGNQAQKERWLPNLATGETLAAFALSEPDVGSDAKSIQTTATQEGGEYVLSGHKRWTTYGQVANLFLVFAQCRGMVSAFLVPRDTPGLQVRPLTGMLGTRASMLAEISLDDCRVPREYLLGGLGFGLASVATSALDIGRYTVAWGCVGIIQACLEASLRYAGTRQQFSAYLKDHQLIQQMIADMFTDAHAARLLCLRAGYLKDIGDPNTIMETWVAKYFASLAANRSASNAVQIHGANGCSSHYPVQRYLRDAKIMEIIEGSTQLQQIAISQYAYQQNFL